ncbi:hypothetical protein [Oceanicoccus sp. KOV_DT_Chl]|nr:hypothetical protein [Oceanicoccus sp. KOV_DT_Chl]
MEVHAEEKTKATEIDNLLAADIDFDAMTDDAESEPVKAKEKIPR